MKNTAKRALARTSAFVQDHKTAITIVTTAAVTTAACIKLTKSLNAGFAETANEFLTEKGLLEEFTNRYFEDIN